MKKRPLSSSHFSRDSESLSVAVLKVGVDHFLTDSDIQDHTRQILDNGAL